MFHVKHDYEAVLGSLGLAATPERVDRLRRYEALLRDRAIPLGIVGRADADRLATRHVADALRAAPLLVDASSAMDLGSGAGLPGLPLAIVTESVRWHLVEPRRRRAAFLELVRDDLGLANVDVERATAEQVHRTVDVVVARALAEPTEVWRLAAPLLAPGGGSWSGWARRWTPLGSRYRTSGCGS